jgi:heme A synthase
VLVQVALGVLTVLTRISIAIVTAHLVTGALLLLDLLALFWVLGPVGYRAPRQPPEAQGELAGASS